MNKQTLIEKLKQDGFTDIRVCPIPPNQDLPEHTHDEHTVHIILDGELTITDADGTKLFRSGDRVEFPAGTTHKARGATDNGTMVIGVKTNYRSMQKILPCLWFDDNAEEAAEFYTNIFPNSKIHKIVPYTVETPSNKPIGSVMTVSFELDGYSFLGLNGGSYFKPNPSVSFQVKCKTIEEVDSYYEKLSENGKILMELNEYPFSKRYAWVEDKWGVSWQIIYKEKDFNQKIVPAFLFTQDICGKAGEAIKSYVKIFPESKIDVISEYGKNEFNEKEDYVRYSEFTLVNKEFIAMDAE